MKYKFAKLANTIMAIGLGVAASVGAHAAEFKIGVEATDYMPISKGDAGEYSGYAREVLDAFAVKYGHKFTYVSVPVARLYDEFLVKKSVDFKFPDNGFWASDAKKGITLTYSKGLLSVIDGSMVLPANKGKKASITNLVTVRGFTPFPYLDSIKAGKVSVTEVTGPDQALKMVASGQSEAAYLGVMAANYIMEGRLNMPGALVLDDKLPSSTNDFVVSTIAHPNVIKQLDEFLTKEKATVEKLKAKYKIAK
jgi:ABC-type amino acid transport substrate-binding protein